jgi:N-acetylmuramic acid 6-phosphate etherase
VLEPRELELLRRLDTETVRSDLPPVDTLPVANLVELMAFESTRASAAVLAAKAQISEAVSAVTERLIAGGRLIYVGAGSAGRLGVLDAAEAGPTFGLPDGLIVGIIAGGTEAMVRPSEHAEDEAETGSAELATIGCAPADAVVGISASGRTPFVVGAIDYARACGALTVGIACNRGSPLARQAELPIELLVGGEVIAGSTRLNAGTAQKITLNILSTAVMVQLGKTHGNMMVDLRATNDKLRDRATRIVATVANTSLDRAAEALEIANWETKVACVVAAAGISAAEATKLLEESGGQLRLALETAESTKG